MNKIVSFAVAIAVATLASSCSKTEDKDTLPPVIELHEPADGDTLFIGYETHLEMDLSDNVKLKSYKVDIHNNLDGHGHTKSTAVDAVWSFTKSWDVSGLKNTHIHHHEIAVPINLNGALIALGNYHFTIYCTDEAGNESHVVKNVVVGVGVPHKE